MKKIKYLLPIMALALFSCDNYLDINEDPNNIPIEDVQPRLFLAGAQLGPYRVQSTTANQLGNVFMNSWGANVNSFTGGYSREYSLTVDNAFYNGIWDGLYRSVNNLQAIIDYPNPTGEQDNFVAIAKVLKAHYMQIIVDLYGDAIYTEAFKGQSNVTPRYNDDQFIYRGLLTELDEARALITAADPSVAIDATGTDIMFAGDMTKWTEMANTVELRMLLRMSENTGNVAIYRDTRLQALSGASFLSTNAAINPGFNSSTDDQMNPFVLSYMVDAAGTRTTNNRFVCASGHMAKFMNGSTAEIIPASGKFYPGVVDNRRARMWRTVGGVVAGVDQGAVSGSPGAANPVSNLGWFAFDPYFEIGFPSPFTYGNTKIWGAHDGYVLTLSESEFLQAEAAFRYPTWFSGAQMHFNAGVSESFDYFFATGASSYLTSVSTKPGIGWTNTASDLEAIMTQKWLALTHVNAIQSFIDYTKTGFPVTPLALTAGQANKPNRLIYPVSEYVANSANVPVVSTAEAFTVTPKSPFWLLGDPALGN